MPHPTTDLDLDRAFSETFGLCLPCLEGADVANPATRCATDPDGQECAVCEHCFRHGDWT